MMNEMPLVLFTVFSQWAIGAFATLWLLERAGRNISRKTGFRLSLIIAGIGVAGILVSLFHLGHPFEAYRALTNVGVSWLSREVTLYSVFTLLSVLYCYAWMTERDSMRLWTGALGTLFGIATIFSSAMIYTIPSIPAWDNASTTLFFFLTALELGPFFTGWMLLVSHEQSFSFPTWTLGSLVTAAIVFVVYLSSLFSGLPEAAESARQMVTSFIFWLRVLCFLVAFFMLARAWKKGEGAPVPYYGTALSLLLVSEWLGRILFYDTAVHL